MPVVDVDSIETRPDDLIVFVDDTGHETFADPANPTFGLGGCATLQRDYARTLANPWNELKCRHFGGVSTPMHAAKMRFKPDQMVALGHFFRATPFFRFAAVCRAELVKHPKYENAYDALAEPMMRCVRLEAERVDPVRLVMVLEASQRGDRLAQRYLGGFRAARIGRRGVEQLPIVWCLMAKSARQPGLEVADFVAHTAGGQARQADGDAWSSRRDFSAMFDDVSSERAEFMLVEKADLQRGARLPPGVPEVRGVPLGSERVDEPKRDE